MPGDEIVNVNGSRLRGLPMAEAKRILRNCCLNLNLTVDIVIARSNAANNSEDGSSGNSMHAFDTIDQPLSLLAHHDEQVSIPFLQQDD